MTWRTIAKKDARAVLDSRTFRWFLAIVAIAFVFGGYMLPLSVEAPTTSDLPSSMTDAVTLLLPLLGIMLGYKAIVGERTSGRLNLLLSLPHSRRDVVVGKLVGRGGLLAAAVSVGIVLGALLVYYPFGTLEPLVLASYLLVTVCFGLAFVGIALAISTLTTSEHLATAGAFGTFFVLVVVWPQLQPLFSVALERVGLASGGLPEWALFVHGATPGLLYERVVEGFYGGASDGPYLGPDAAWYLGEWVALALLIAWAIVPITLGYLRFQSTDL